MSLHDNLFIYKIVISLSFNRGGWPRNLASNLGRGKNILKRVPVGSDKSGFESRQRQKSSQKSPSGLWQIWLRISAEARIFWKESQWALTNLASNLGRGKNLLKRVPVGSDKSGFESGQRQESSEKSPSGLWQIWLRISAEAKIFSKESQWALTLNEPPNQRVLGIFRSLKFTWLRMRSSGTLFWTS